MTPDYIMKKLSAIKEAASGGDDEQAHILEDELHEEVLRFIAENQSSTRYSHSKLAKLALVSKGYKFTRMCA